MVSGFSLRFGDLMQADLSPGSVRVVTTNGAVRRDGACVMGRGIARQVRDSFPDLPFKLGGLIREYGNRPFRLTPTIWTLPVKHRWDEQADPLLIRESLVLMGEMVVKWQPPAVHMPRPGCGNGGLDWRLVSPIVHELTDHWPSPVFVWDFQRRG